MKPVLDLARHLDIATNPDPQAIFEAGNSGFEVWCTPQDRPQGWDDIHMLTGSFAKPCEYVGSARWKWEAETIVALAIRTAAYALADQKPDQYSSSYAVSPDSNLCSIFNRRTDLEWLREKITWLFREAGVPMPPLDSDPVFHGAPQSGFLLVRYVSPADQYLMIIPPGSNVEDFCQAGYQITQRLGIPHAGGFPIGVALREQHDFPKPGPDPDDEAPVKHSERSAQLHADEWLEGEFEDRISGCGE